jgi:hypothetical protein
MTSALEGGEWSAARPGRNLPPGKTRYPLYRGLGGPQGRSGQARTIQMALVHCIPDCLPSTLSSAHHVVYGYNPAEHTEDLCVDWWIILKRILQKQDGRTQSRDGEAMRATIPVSIHDTVYKTSRQPLEPPISCVPEALTWK